MPDRTNALEIAVAEKDLAIQQLKSKVIELEGALASEAARRQSTLVLLQELRDVTSKGHSSQPHQEMTFTLAWWKIPVKDFLCGAVSGFAGKIVEFPFDTIKVKMQTQTKGEYSSSMQCFRKVLGRSGVPGLYQGLPIPLAGTMLETSILFTSMGQAKSLLTKGENRELTMPEVLVAGGVAGLSVAFILTPVELVKCRMQSQPMSSISLGQAGADAVADAAASAGKEMPKLYKVRSPFMLCVAKNKKTQVLLLFLQNSIDCVVQSVRQEGIGVLFKGLTATV